MKEKKPKIETKMLFKSRHKSKLTKTRKSRRQIENEANGLDNWKIKFQNKTK